MVIRIEIKGLENVQKYFIELPRKEERELSQSNFEFMKKVLRSAKARAPRDTGILSQSLTISKTITKGSVHQFKLISNAEHSVFQEEGFKPHVAFILNSAKLTPGFYFVKKFTPFIKPALEHNLSIFSQELERGVNKAIAK